MNLLQQLPKMNRREALKRLQGNRDGFHGRVRVVLANYSFIRRSARGYVRLVSPEGNAYRVRVGENMSCELCPDYTYRQAEYGTACKHIRAVYEALHSGQ